MWRRIWALFRKELLVLWKDPRSRAVLIGPPLVQLLVFGYAATFDIRDVRTGILDADDSPTSRAVVALFAGSPTFDPLVPLAGEAALRRAIDGREVAVAIRIQPGFEAALRAGRPAPLQLVLDGRQSNTSLGILAYAQEIVDHFNQALEQEAGFPGPPARLEIRSWFNPNLESRWFIVPGLTGLLSMVVVLVVTALSVARERELGTFEQLLVTPYRPLEILAGKALPALLIGLAEGTLIVAVAVFWFEIPLRGSLALLYLGLIIFILAIAGVGLMVSALSRTQQQAILGAFLFVVPAVILSGFATPIMNMPETIQTITLANPFRYFLVILRSVFLRDTPFELLLDQIWPMAVIALLTLTAATVMFRRRLY